MSRLRAVKAALAAAIALCSLAAVATAGAAAWQGPTTISEPAVNAGASPVIALGRSGDAGAVWLDDTSGGRVAMARKRAGAAWSVPVTAAAPVTGTPLFAGVDGAGNITAAYPSGGTTSTVATWLATAATPTLTPLPGSLTVTDLAVDASGDAVLAGQTGSPAGLTVGYRRGPTGAFAFHTYTYVAIGNTVTAARVAINGSGTAIVVFVAGPTLGAATRTATADWPATFETVTTPATVTGTPAVGIDSAGNAVAAFASVPAPGTSILRAALRPAAGGWLPSGDLSAATAGSLVSSIDLAVNPAGAAALVWLQATAATQNVQARVGTTSSGFLGNAEDVNDAGATDPVAAIADDGSVVAAWERAATGGSIGQGRVRSGGSTGSWGDTRTLSAVHANSTSPSLAADGRGDFATVSAPYDGTYHPVILSAYDAASPALTPPTQTGGPFTGIPVTLATTASDAWSTVGTPAWTFGDGGTGTGLSVAHTYATAGTYTAHVSVTDGSGNTAGADVTVVVKPAIATIATARFNARWKHSRVGGTLSVAGTAPIAGTYVVDVAKDGKRRLHASVKLAPGAFSRAFRLPATLLPGTYRVSLLPGSALVQTATADVKLAAPAEGVVDVAFLSGSRAGTAAHTLTGARTLWASFHFAAIPQGKLTLTWYAMVRGKRVRLAVAAKRPAATVRGSVALLGRRGTIVAVLSRAGKVIAQSTVRVR